MLTPIPGYPLYLATPYGDIHRAGSLGYVKPKRDKQTGSIRVNISDIYGNYQKVSVHRLIALAFIPNPEDHDGIIHIDADQTNNCVENLKWASIFEIGARR